MNIDDDLEFIRGFSESLGKKIAHTIHHDDRPNDFGNETVLTCHLTSVCIAFCKVKAAEKNYKFHKDFLSYLTIRNIQQFIGAVNELRRAKKIYREICKKGLRENH